MSTFTPAQLAKPIRIGMIGLSGSDSASWAANAHYPYLRKSSAYQITALLNSSIESARAARDTYKLPADTKLYDSAEDLAKDPNVDLVVCNARVDRHLPLTRPSVAAGKNVFVEWPLGRNLKEAEELATLAKEKQVRAMIGLQGTYDPLGRKIRSLVESGRIGKLLSVDVHAVAHNYGHTESARVEYITKRAYGGNMVTIHFTHLMSTIIAALGELKDFNTLLRVGRTEVDIVDSENKVLRRVQKDSHDQVALHGELQDSGALLNVFMRGGPKFKGEDHGVVWKLYGEKGELRVTAPSFALHIGFGAATKLSLHDLETDTLEEIDYTIPEEEAFFGDLPVAAQNVGREYERFAQGEGYLDFEAALVRHRMVEKLYESAENGGVTVSYL